MPESCIDNQKKTVLIDEMTDYYPLFTTFTPSRYLAIDSYKYDQKKLYPNPNDRDILRIDTPNKNIKTGIAYSILGQEINCFTLTNNEIDISKLYNGFTERVIIK